MKQSDPLELVEAGTLARPGVVGRLLRLLLGALCFYALADLIGDWRYTAEHPISLLPNRILVIGLPVYLFNYVVNIGFGRSWGRRPMGVSLTVMLTLACAGWLLAGNPDNIIFGLPLNLWLGYFYSHLGLSFILSALMATPGCEMRAIPELLGKLSGKASAEHHCPAGFLQRIDTWERDQLQPR